MPIYIVVPQIEKELHRLRAVVYTFGALGHFALENSTYKIDEICSLFIVEKDVKIKHKIYFSTISNL